jgi:hypothetical protein
MQRYDPLKAPDPEEWLALDEQERIDLVRDYHRRARIKLPDATLHAVMHAIVENQIALGEQLSVRRTTQRLMDEGLDRHDAIHAVGSVLAEFIFDIFTEPKPHAVPNAAYFAALERLTAEGWLRSG